MATPTYTPIATVTASGSSVYLEATAIPSTYTDLIVVLNIKESGSDGLNIQLGNGSYDTGSNYSNTYLQGNGSSAGSGRASNQTYAEIGIESAVWGTTILQFQNYSNTNVFKTILSRSNSTNFYVRAVAALWRSTSAIERIRIYNGSNANHSAGSTMTIYGIANAAIGAPKATGGIITYDNTYYYHTFGASGTFTPQQSLTADILVVAGGGGGGRRHGGGGGAGGLLYQTGRSLSATGYSITVGAGGAGNSTGYPNGNGASGANTTFDTITANGGGGGGGANISPSNGGSGGGSQASWATTATATQGNSGGATGYGFNGGAGYSASGINHGAGGGGAGAIGGDADASNSGNGGAGRQYLEFSNATGTGVVGYYAGGGGGATFDTGNSGSGGAGGGGAGNKVGSGVNGVTNTGSGGGAQGDDNGGQGGNGGSGVVIIRYLKA